MKTDVPARLDRLPWSRFHLLIVVGLGVTWILDGLEVTIVGALGPALQNPLTLHLSSANLGAIASFYVIGAVTGALVSGWVTDRFGRRLVFYATLIVYLAGVLLSACAWSFGALRFSGCSPAWELAVNMPPSIPPSTNSFRQNIAAVST
nr:MFS transporter [Bradyrhizobium canariense]